MTTTEKKQVASFRKSRSWTRLLSDEAVLDTIKSIKASKDTRKTISRQLSALGMI
jgi:hypothetical protein